MRFLFSTIAGYGHICPMIPLAQALVAAGHQVAFATSRLLTPELTTLGFEVLPCGPDWKESDFFRDRPEANKLGHTADGMAEFFNEQYIPASTHDLDLLVPSWLPDVILSNDFDSAGRAVAEKYAIPFALMTFGPRVPRSLKAQWHSHSVNIARQVLGLPVEVSLAYTYRWLHLYFTPESYFWGANEYIEADNEFGIRPAVYDRFGGVARTPMAQQNAGKITALCTFGTVFNLRPELIQNVIAAVSGQVDRLLVLLGPHIGRGSFSNIQDNVEFHRSLSLTETLPYVDYCVTHGGTSTLLSMMLAGKPMLILPQGADQIVNAMACSQQRIGVSRVNVTAPNIDAKSRPDIPVREIQKDMAELIGNPIYRDNCDKLSDGFSQLKSITFAVELLEQLAKKQKPVTKKVF